MALATSPLASAVIVTNYVYEYVFLFEYPWYIYFLRIRRMARVKSIKWRGGASAIASAIAMVSNESRIMVIMSVNLDIVAIKLTDVLN